VRDNNVSPNALPSIAVLAFADMSEGRDHEYFADGMAEEILNLLTRIPNLQVIARTSSFSFKGSHADVIAIGKALDAGYVLEGSVRPSGERVRVTAQLVDARSGVHVWSEAYDHDLDDLLKVQSSIAESVARSLEITLAEGSLAPGTRTVNPEAYEYVLHGRYLHNRRGPGDIAAAEQYLRRAVAADETYAPAWAALAGTLLVRFFEEGATDAATLESMREAVTRALELDPFLPEAQARAAHYYAHAGDFDRATHHRERALAVGPNNPLVLGASSDWALSSGDFELALNRRQRAVQVDPLNAVARANLTIELARAARFEEALVEFQRVRDLNPTRSGLDELEGDILLLAGRFEDALANFERLPEGPKREMGLTLIYRQLGRDADSETQMQKLTARSDYERSKHLAEIHAQWGEQEQAFAWLAAAWKAGTAAAPTPGLRRYPHYVMQSPYLRPLYGDPRWKQYLWEANT
jgi:TolB-like protein/Tfp pilus assembly protein PilF